MENPRITPTAWTYPGACALTKSSDGPFLDTGLDTTHDGRVFLTVRLIEEMAVACGLPTTAIMDEVVEERDEAREQLNIAARRLGEQSELIEQYEALARAIAYTLQNGARVGRNNTLHPKIKPGDSAGVVAAALERAGLENFHDTIVNGPQPSELNPSAQ